MSTETGRSERPWLALVAVCLGVMMTFVNITATVGSLSAIQADLHASATTIVWVTSAYSLVVAGLTLSMGTLGDLLGRRLVFLAGTAVLGAGSVLAFTAHSAGALIAAEAVMGAGGAMILPTSLTIVSHNFPDPHQRTEAISIWAGASGLGLAAGPIVAGALLEGFSWHSVFLANAVLAVVVLIVTPLLVAESRHLGRRLDVPGLLLATTTVTALTYAIIEGGHNGIGAGRVLTALAVFVVALALFVVVELRSADPMLQLRLFRSVAFSTAMLVAVAAMFGFGGVPLLVVLYVQRVQGASALDTGFQLLPLFVVYIAVSAVAARLARRVGLRVMLGGGLLITAAGAALLLITPAHQSYAHVWPGLVLFGLGEGLVLAPVTAAAVASVGAERAGMASAALNMFRQIGSVLGTSILGTILTSHFASKLAEAEAPPTAFTESVHLGFAVAAVVFAVVSVPAWLYSVRRKAVQTEQVPGEPADRLAQVLRP
ncbi:MFS transporter [Winogradskya consettensis]|uniref:MFS transporter n=1 Tax=Winogradskya consettensis TaxID=113560 RepID=A0A919VUG7_9ACTN|nr:MFS transporter [Actinoplanes consettensis]GIM79374.1 MFS transporter [Actinoplanes consettensis]